MRLFRFLLRLLREALGWRSRAPRLPETQRAPKRGLKGGALRVEYAPRPDGAPDPGEIVWAWVPYEDDPSQGKDRPVLVFGRHGGQLAAVALTSKRRDRDPQFELGPGPWDQQGRTSYVTLSRILKVDPASVRREGSALDARRFERVVAAIRQIHG